MSQDLVYNLDQYQYHLPARLIAQYPSQPRDSAHLLVLNKHTGEIEDRIFNQVGDYLCSGDVLVLNTTRVIPARLLGVKTSGAAVEILLLKKVGGEWEALTKPARRLRPGHRILFPDHPGVSALITGETEAPGGRRLIFENCDDNAFIQTAGHMPLPPYITRGDEGMDQESYQTVYARHSGSAAAPTAGLHFTPQLLEELRSRGVVIVTILLHVGLGTFRPVASQDIRQHQMHAEYYRVDPPTARLLNDARRAGRRIIAVGTTVVRTLETIYDDSMGFQAGEGETVCFIYPGIQIRSIDGMITNFHLPGSSLLMLVSALAGLEQVKTAYRHAVQQEYRFFSYGDAMLIL